MKLQDVCLENLKNAGLVNKKEIDYDDLYYRLVCEIVGSYIQEKLIRAINNYCDECSKDTEENERKYFPNTYDTAICRKVGLTEYNRIKRCIIKTLNEKYKAY